MGKPDDILYLQSEEMDLATFEWATGYGLYQLAAGSDSPHWHSQKKTDYQTLDRSEEAPRKL